MTIKTRRNSLAIVIGALILGAQPFAYAKFELEEVIVTAEKRAASLQDVPSAVTALTANDLDRANITNLSEIDAQVPGLTIAKSEGFQRIVAIRGLGFEANQNDIANPSVSFHIDDVYISDPISLNQDLLDVERIEVMRGPQGTVFGQNSTGGTINVITKNPKLEEFNGKVDLTVGTYNTIRPRGSINIPLGDTVALRVAASHNKHDGYAEVKGGPIGGYKLDEEDNTTARAKLLIQPTDNLSFLFSVQYYDTDVHDRAQRSILDPGSNIRKVHQDYPGKFAFKSKIYSVKAIWDLPAATVKYIGSYQDEQLQSSMDGDRGITPFEPVQDIITTADRGNKTYTHEINIVSSDENPLPFEWILGAFYLEQKKNVEFLEFVDKNDDGIVVVNESNPFAGELGFQTTATPKRRSESAFAQATFNLTDNLHLTTGARYTDDKVTSTINNFFDPVGTNLEVSSQKLTGKVSLEWAYSKDKLVYVSWSKGYKPGGTNLTSGSVFVSPDFAEEEVIAWEVGSKTDLLDGRMRLNTAAFFYDFDNLQFMATDPVAFSGGVDNMPKTEIYGAEFELTAFLTDNLRLDGNATFLKGEFTNDKMGLDVKNQQLFNTAFNISASENLKGNTPPKMPETALSLTLIYTVELAGGELSSRVQYKYRDEYESRVYNNSLYDTVPSSETWNLSFLYTPSDAAWDLELLVTNVTDEESLTSRFTNTFGVGQTSDEYAAPRQVLLRAGLKF